MGQETQESSPQNKQKRFLHGLFLHTLRFIRTQNLLFANSLLTFCAPHLTLEMGGSCIAYGGRVPLISPMVSVGERGRGHQRCESTVERRAYIHHICTPICNNITCHMLLKLYTTHIKSSPVDQSSLSHPVHCTFLISCLQNFIQPISPISPNSLYSVY